MTPGYGHHPLVPTFYEAEPGPADIRLKCLLSWSWSWGLTELEKCYLSATMSLLVSNDFQPYNAHLTLLSLTDQDRIIRGSEY